MSHAYHPALPGYHEDQLLIDGCGECERRGKDPRLAIAYLDAERFERAWLRAAAHHASRPPGGTRAKHVSRTERPMLDALWSVQVQLERRGIPIGECPERRLVV